MRHLKTLPIPPTRDALGLGLAGRRPLVLRSLGLVGLVLAWALAVALARSTPVPSPLRVAAGMLELVQRQVIVRHTVASLFRVTWGYLGALALALPLGLLLGWFRRGELALSPLLQVLRPISPLAWIPISILWFGVGDVSAIFIIFLASFFPLVTTVASAVRGVPEVHLRAGRNFGLTSAALLWRVVLPAAIPRIFVGMRLTLGVAWLVVVAAEMLGVNSGLGFLILDARNAGNRYDLVMATMVLIGGIGVGLDALMRWLQRAMDGSTR
ncbi:ABC transporter permease [Myxococcaceae bacterium JPH2]|nr:ABC transporter permease [Myxococcaceae bacterium JPH2]